MASNPRTVRPSLPVLQVVWLRFLAHALFSVAVFAPSMGRTLVIDSITGFSDAPIKATSAAGVTLAVFGAVLGLVGLVLLPSVGAGLLLLLAAVAGFIHAATKGANKEIVHTT